MNDNVTETVVGTLLIGCRETFQTVHLTLIKPNLSKKYWHGTQYSINVITTGTLSLKL